MSSWTFCYLILKFSSQSFQHLLHTETGRKESTRFDSWIINQRVKYRDRRNWNTGKERTKRGRENTEREGGGGGLGSFQFESWPQIWQSVTLRPQVLDVIWCDMELLPSLLSTLSALDPDTLDQEYSVSVHFHTVRLSTWKTSSVRTFHRTFDTWHLIK